MVPPMNFFKEKNKDLEQNWESIIIMVPPMNFSEKINILNKISIGKKSYGTPYEFF